MGLNAIQKQSSKQSQSQFRSSRRQMFFKIGALENFTQVFSSEYFKIFKNNVYIENLR